mmetsp:Transcript_16664/g.31533  ORF Transcript_16664/g.31533 Transcript_16664/m.31533 type:complete len:169 (-) Transcript_16664:229-735(-)
MTCRGSFVLFAVLVIGSADFCPNVTDTRVHDLTFVEECAGVCSGACSYIDSILGIGRMHDNIFAMWGPIDDVTCNSSAFFSCIWNARNCTVLLEDISSCPIIRAPADVHEWNAKCGEGSTAVVRNRENTLPLGTNKFSNCTVCAALSGSERRLHSKTGLADVSHSILV